MVVELKEHQQDAVDKLDYGKILYGGTGSGKTITSIAFFFTKVMGGVIGDMASVRRPKNLYVLTTAKKRDSLDWEEEAIKFGISTDDDKSIPGCVIKVDSWNNIGKYTDVKDAFFVFDEQRVVGSGAWVKSFLKIAAANGWILLSATPGDTWLDYIPVFIANGFYKTKTEFSREHIVWQPYTKFPKVQRYTNVNKLVRLKHKILVEMPYDKHTTREVMDVLVDYDLDMMNKAVKQRWHPFEDRPIRDVAELFHVMRKVVNSDDSRLEAVKKLWEEHPKLIVFYNFNYELEALRSLATDAVKAEVNSLRMTSTPLSSTSNRKLSSTSKPESSTTSSSLVPSRTSESTEKTSSSQTSARSTKSSGDEPIPASTGSSNTSSTETPSVPAGITSAPMDSLGISSSTTPAQIAEWNGHKHEPIPDTDRWLYLVQYVAGAEGWNCTSTDAMVFYSLTYSYKNFMQAQGRIDRMNTPFSRLKYYVLISTAAIDKAVRRSLADKKNFNERKYYPKFEEAA